MMLSECSVPYVLIWVEDAVTQAHSILEAGAIGSTAVHCLVRAIRDSPYYLSRLHELVELIPFARGELPKMLATQAELNAANSQNMPMGKIEEALGKVPMWRKGFGDQIVEQCDALLLKWIVTKWSTLKGSDETVAAASLDEL
jgi:hypothetical protein